MFLGRYIKEVYGAVKSLLTGMRRTGYYFTHHKEIITQQYPDNRESLVLPERFRGEVVMPHDEHNEHRCTGCTACEIACPNGTIKVITKFDLTPEGKKKKAIDKLVYHLESIGSHLPGCSGVFIAKACSIGSLPPPMTPRLRTTCRVWP